MVGGRSRSVVQPKLRCFVAKQLPTFIRQIEPDMVYASSFVNEAILGKSFQVISGSRSGNVQVFGDFTKERLVLG